MQQLSLRLPGAVLFGHEVINRIPELLKDHGTRVLLLSESVLNDGRFIDRVADIIRRADMDCIVYDELGPGATTTVVDELASLARASQAQIVVGMGGMRVLSIARCVANVAVEGLTFQKLRAGTLPRKPLAYVEIPTSYRDHLMMRPECIIKDETSGHAAVFHIHPATTRAAVVDTVFSETLSAKYALAAIVDTLLAAIEGFLSPGSMFLSDALFQAAIGFLQQAAMAGVRNPTDSGYRAHAAEGAIMTALALSAVPQGPGGALSYAINARFGVPKSWVATILLPHVAESLAAINPDKMALVARALNEPVQGILAAEDAQRAVKGVRKLVSYLDLPTRLQELDVTMAELMQTAEVAADFDMLAFSASPASAAELQRLAKLAF